MKGVKTMKRVKIYELPKTARLIKSEKDAWSNVRVNYYEDIDGQKCVFAYSTKCA